MCELCVTDTANCKPKTVCCHNCTGLFHHFEQHFESIDSTYDRSNAHEVMHEPYEIIEISVCDIITRFFSGQ